MTTRFPCKTEGCTRTIIHTMAQETGGFCRPCFQGWGLPLEQQLAAARSEEIPLQVDKPKTFDPVKDPVKSIVALNRNHCQTSLSDDTTYLDQAMNVLSQITARRAKRFVKQMRELIETDEELAIEIAALCQVFGNIPLASLAKAFFDKKVDEPAFLYLQADQKVRDQSLKNIAKLPVHREFNLTVMAWIGDSLVQRKFAAWLNEPPNWITSKQVITAMHLAGWTMDQTGQRQELHSNQAFPLLTDSEQQDAVNHQTHATACPGCERPLFRMFQIDARFNLLSGSSLPTWELLNCEVCCVESTFFMKLDQDGRAHYSDHNAHQHNGAYSGDLAPLTVGTIAFETTPKIKTFGGHHSLPGVKSKVGGLPLADITPPYPPCPSCTRTMFFVGQIIMDELESGHEAIYFGFICDSCLITAATIQTS